MLSEWVTTVYEVFPQPEISIREMNEVFNERITMSMIILNRNIEQLLSHSEIIIHDRKQYFVHISSSYTYLRKQLVEWIMSKWWTKINNAIVWEDLSGRFFVLPSSLGNVFWEK